MSLSAIEAAIPHRAPFLFLDRIAGEGQGWIEVEWTVPAAADWLRGHFPGRPVTPGVLLAEHAFQAGAVLIAHAQGGLRPEDGVPILARISDARYRRRVEPGETLATRVEVDQCVGPAWHLKARIACGADKVATLSFVLAASGAVARLELP